MNVSVRDLYFENGQWTDHYVYYLNTHDEILKT